MLFVGFLVFLCAVPPLGWGQYEVQEELPIRLRGVLDVRIARGGRASSWTDDGIGTGKARYGGRVTAQGEERVTRLAISQLALEVGGTLPGDVVAHAQFNAETDIDHDRPLLIEAFLRKEWGEWEHGWGLQGGVMNIPFSQEHTGPAWTPRYTLTPSALNTWLWEEVRLVGLEGEWWRVTRTGMRLGLLAGAGFGPDQMAKLLVTRGWVLSDYLSGINSDLPLPQRGEEVSVFEEQDHRPAIYLRSSLSDSRGRGELSLGYFDNLGDQGTTGVWETRFGSVGAILHPFAKVDFLAQYLGGTAQSRARNSNVLFQAFYLLLSFHHRGHRFSVRYDDFRIDELDGPPMDHERGDVVTLAYLFEFGLSHRVAFEYSFLHSRRVMPARSDPSDDGWQLSYRFRY